VVYNEHSLCTMLQCALCTAVGVSLEMCFILTPTLQQESENRLVEHNDTRCCLKMVPTLFD